MATDVSVSIPAKARPADPTPTGGGDAPVAASAAVGAVAKAVAKAAAVTTAIAALPGAEGSRAADLVGGHQQQLADRPQLSHAFSRCMLRRF